MAIKPVKLSSVSIMVWVTCSLMFLMNVLMALSIHDPFGFLFNFVIFLYQLVGALIVTRRPENTIGWILFFCATFAPISYFIDIFSAQFVNPNPEPPFLYLVIAWVNNWAGNLIFGTILSFVFLLFPNGKLPSPRWRWLAWLNIIFLSNILINDIFSPGPLDVAPNHTNPFGILILENFFTTFSALTLPLFLPIIFLNIFSLVVRYHHSIRTERQQIKWVVYTAVLSLMLFLTAALLSTLFPNNSETILNTAWGFTIIALPISIGIAILGYRLYDIDLIIRRTLVYAVLSATLALFYFGIVIFLQSSFSVLTGSKQTDLATVASTLIIAFSFMPLRKRIQSTIDRRFYRKKYNAAQTLSSFSQQLRGVVDIESLSKNMLDIVQETMQPDHLSLWLKQRNEKAAG